MPPRPPAGNVIETIVTYTIADGHRAINKVHYFYAGTPNATDMAAFALHIGTQWAASWTTTGFCGNDVNQVSVECTDIGSLTGVQAFDLTNHAGGGATFCNAAVAGLIEFHIARRYRGGKPKIFVPGILQNAMATDSTLTAGTVAQLNTLGNGHLNAFGGFTSGSFSSSTAANVSYYSGFTNYVKTSGRNASRPTLRVAPVTDLLLSATAKTMAGSQRRRRLPS